MPLMHSKSKKAFGSNVRAEMNAGKPQKQALAIAYSVKRKAAHKAHGGFIGLQQGMEMKDLVKRAMEKRKPKSESISEEDYLALSEANMDPDDKESDRPLSDEDMGDYTQDNERMPEDQAEARREARMTAARTALRKIRLASLMGHDND